MRNLMNAALLCAAVTVAMPACAATAVGWSSITGYTNNPDGTTTATATMNVGGTNVDVTYSGVFSFVQTASSGTNYWNQGNQAPYTGGQYSEDGVYYSGQTLADAPGDNSLIALSANGPITITFSQAVSDVYMALVSWNGDGISDFSSPYSLVSSGDGHWGTGTFTDVSSTGFMGSDELHGVIEFAGPMTSLTFNTTGSGEYWHGFLVGSESVADVPEPASWAMFIGGFGLIGGALRRRQTTAVTFA